MSRVAKTESFESFVKSRSRTEAPHVGKNLFPDTWTADGEGALSELSPCPHVMTTADALVVEERSWRRPDAAVLNLTTLL